MNFFDDALHFRNLLRELGSWKGTKYSHTGVCIKGIGSDCVRFVFAALAATGAVQPPKFPKYVTKNGGAAMLDLMIRSLESIPQLRRVWQISQGPPPDKIGRGWILVISTGRAHHHLSLVGNPPQVWHCLEEVSEANYFDSSIRNHLFAIYEVENHG